MSASKTRIKKSKEETAEWTGLFQGDLKTEQASLVFVKRMMAVAVSSITYLRGIFPEDAYRSRYLEDLCIKVLREDCSTPGANKVVKWMMGCFDALEKQYLQIVFIGVYTNPDDPNCIIESYQFKFKYTEKGPELNILRNNAVRMQVTLEDTKRASVLLIRKLFLLMQNLGSLPNNVYLTMKLYYYDDMTPEDYEPPGFKEGECDSLWFEGTAIHFKVGNVQTPFHTLRVRVSAEQGRLAKLQEGNYLRDSKLEKNVKMDYQKKEIDEEDVPSEDESAQFKKPTQPLAKRKAMGKTQAKRKRII
ncbi:HORMA domain-containing protein 1-like isoform X3 [Boleophthalmus pectinirostris]|uniref:zebrafish testis-expressed 38 isoform X1 n=1 Tax=Boleophthalmus pectinirostris TaxID=150288 RepID=UPI002431F7E0|nr:zebrafish testis-expressed 38 isoform X1 [Boleophthalmus pectinirostris]XP_055008070.1 HORMA domain-containing protein 1-like isoform X3 [Boleophthalmus pectinirostris]